MKKLWIRVLSLTLCLLMLAPLLAACGDTEDGTTPADTTPPEEILSTEVVKIRVEADQLYDENGFMDLTNLVDEFDESGDPAAGTGAKLGKPVDPPGGWKDGLGLSVTIDLGADYHITSVYFYNRFTGSQLSFATKADRLDAWSAPVVSEELPQWTEVKLNADCHYINMSAPSAASVPMEIVLYGYRTSAYDQVPEPAERTEYPTIGEFMGLNGNVASNTRHLTAGTYLREYHNWLWSEQADNWGTGLPSANYTSTAVGNFDSFYYMCQRVGVKPVPCLMFTDDHSLFENGQSRPSAPLEDGSYDSDNATTYYLYAGAIYQYVARYGSNKFIDPETGKSDLSTIKVLLGGKKVGLGYIEYIELGNEPNLDWEHVDDYHSPFQLAALSSASYDGHEGALGAGYGAKCADPNIKVAMGGLAGIPLDYIRSMHLWAQFNRQDGQLPVDVINVHSYCEKRVKIDGRYYTVGVSPEEYGLVEDLQALVEWRDTYYPDKEIWLSEFGWDTSGLRSSSVAVLAYGDYTTRQLQAMWLVRGFLLLSASGIDKAQMFMCDGQNDDDGGRFATCGLIDGDGQKKESWYYMRTLLTTMGDMAFCEEIETGRDDLTIYHYKNAEGKSSYAVWCPTSNSTKIENYTFNIGASAADLVEFADKAETGVVSPLTVDASGNVTVTATECPILIVTK